MTHLCTNCHNAPPFEGWDECCACGVAILLVEQPSYIDWAKVTYADKPVWLRELSREWQRQSAALACVEAA